MSYNDDFFDTFNNFDKLAKSIFDDTSIVNRPFNQNDFLSTYLSLVTNLDPKSIKTLIHMILNSNENGFYTGTYEDLMESLSVSRATLAAIMGELQKQSLIEKTKDGWKVIVNYQLPKDGASIVIKFDNDFNRNNIKDVLKDDLLNNKDLNKLNYDKNKINDIKNLNIKDNTEKIRFEAFKKFLKEFYISMSRIDSAKAFRLNDIKMAEFVNEILDKYREDSKKMAFVKFVDEYNYSKELKNYNEYKDFLIHGYDVFKKYYSNCYKIFVADFDDNSFANIKARYFTALDNCNDLSGETRIILKNILLSILNVARVYGKCDAKTVFCMITNEFDIGRKILMEAEMILKSKHSYDYNYVLKYLKDYKKYISGPNRMFDIFYSLANLAEDKYKIVKYFD